MDSATAYEQHARAFLQAREASEVGAALIRRWAHSLPPGAEVLEVACGGGYPVTRELAAAGLKLWAIDSSPTLLNLFRRRFPKVVTRCERVQTSTFFDRTFDAIVAVGIVFLLPESEQLGLFRQVAKALKPGGRWLFSAPLQTGTWQDLVTGNPCLSLGETQYREALSAVGLQVVDGYEDEGQNHYYEAVKQSM
jgi:2-polyprenyl-3-methyl-5-hydroxy-6-metoxy-1,4-benzoquinol methylase